MEDICPNPLTVRVHRTGADMRIPPIAHIDRVGEFWGHLGLLYPNETKTRWYPITQGTANFIERRLWPDQDEGDVWIIVSTLNNRLLVFAAQAMKRVWLLDNYSDQPHDDWDLTWDGYQGLSPEIYRALEERFFGLDDNIKRTIRRPCGISSMRL